MKITVDTMSGNYAPEEIVKGAVRDAKDRKVVSRDRRRHLVPQ